MTDKAVLARVSWRLRSSEFGALVRYNDGRPIVVMEYTPREPERLAEWTLLRHQWLELAPHGAVLDAIDRGTGASLLVRYAALDWKRAPISLEPGAVARQVVASWGERVTDAYRMIRYELAEHAGRFARPVMRIDLVNDARLAFLPVDPASLSGEAQRAWPRCDERDVVCVIGALIRDHCVGLEIASAASIRTIVERCVQPSPADRYQTLEELASAWSALAYPRLQGDRLEAWRRAEGAIALLEVEEPRLALHAFRAALALNPLLRVAKQGRNHAALLVGEDPEPRRPPRRSGHPAGWLDAAESGQALEAAHDFAAALSLYRRVPLDGVNDAAIHVAVARCQLGLGAHGPAIDYAGRALAIDPTLVAALSIRARGQLTARDHAAALRSADAWLAVAPGDASAHYAKRRALLALGSVLDARDAFDRACTLQPQMLEALLLRREAERAARRVADRAGRAAPMSAEVPDHLAALRDALVGGRTQEVIAVLERAEYHDDAIAIMVRAECLAFEQRFEDALAAYDRAAALSPEQRGKALIGKVHALLALERAAEAIAELDRAGDLDDVALVELRGLALERLGLVGDAERELGRVVDSALSRSELRVRR
ncbi:MAG TPA: hypothetical protein VLX92_00845 [Kofleriaceae bacterium]|nr:hypothetical protein [Kofleriaceae bacterium]